MLLCIIGRSRLLDVLFAALYLPVGLHLLVARGFVPFAVSTLACHNKKGSVFCCISLSSMSIAYWTFSSEIMIRIKGTCPPINIAVHENIYVGDAAIIVSFFERVRI